MPDQPTDTNKSAIKLALAAALGSALGIITAIRTLSAARRGRDQATITAPETAEQNMVSVRAAEELIPIDGGRAESKPPQPALQRERHPDWEALPVAHLPRPTYWPVVLAIGIVFLTWGVATTLAISAVGVLLLALALGGWIGEWRHVD